MIASNLDVAGEESRSCQAMRTTRELLVQPGNGRLVRREGPVEPTPTAEPTALIGAERLTVTP